jgi:hypothetical protein
MSNIHFIQLESYKAPKSVESNKNNWVEFGDKNDYYTFLNDRYNGSTTNNSVINGITKLIYGKGLDASDSNRKPNEYAQMKMLLRKDVVKKLVVDYKRLGQGYLQLIYNKAKNAIVKVEHIPTMNIRVEKCNEKGEITGYYYSDNWQDVKKFPAMRIPAFGYGDKTLEIISVGNYTIGQKYYSNVDYLGALPYAQLEEEIADYLINDVQNGFAPTTIINFNNGIPDEEKQELISNDVKRKTSGSHGVKTIVAFNNDETKKTTIDSVPLNDAPAHYSYLSEEARGKILLGHGVTSGLLFGIPSANGFSSNADELKNAFVLFDNMIIRPFQENLCDLFDEILAFNGIALDLYFKTLQPLEFTDLSPVMDSASMEEETGVKLSSHIDELDVDKYGEEIDLSQWELIDSRPVSYEDEEMLDAELEALNNPEKSLMSKVWEFVTTGVARPNIGSSQDGKLFMSRYRYSGKLSANSREFCRKMIKANKLYRKEDIEQMSAKPSTNGAWSPKGENTYDIFLYKGGGACHHFWTRETYKRFTDPRKKGAEEVTPAEARKAGEILPTPFTKSDGKNYKKDSQLVYKKPIDMPNQGFLNR